MYLSAKGTASLLHMALSLATKLSISKILSCFPPHSLNKNCYAAVILSRRRTKSFDFALSLAVKTRLGLQSLLSGHSSFFMSLHRNTTAVLARRQIQRAICTGQNRLQIHPPSAGNHLIFIYRFAVLQHSLFPLCPQAKESSRCDIFYHRTSS